MANAPSDVLCGVFELLPFVGRVGATHVCKNWRMASLSFPGTLWSRIVSTGRREGVLRQLLDRSQQAPIDVEVLLSDETFADAMAAISEHLFHIRRLHLYSRPLGEDELAMCNIPRIYDALAVPAPILEHLDIGIAIEETDPDDSESDHSVDTELEDVRNFDYRIPVNLFAGYAPCLRRVAWLSMVLPLDGVPALENVTYFSFEGRALSAFHLAAIVSTLPRLMSLHIKVDYGYELPPVSPPATLCLDGIDLEVWNLSSEQSPAALLQYLGYHRTRLVTTDRLPEWLELFVAPPRGLPHSLRVHDGWTDQNSWQFEHTGGHVSQGRSLSSNELLTTQLARDVFSALETLVTHISIVMKLADIPPLPRLVRLFLFCRGTTGGNLRHVLALLDLTQQPSLARLQCPSLRTLEIRNPEPDSFATPTLTVGDVEVLVEHIVPVSHARPHVTLRNFDVPFPRPERVWGRPIADALTVTNDSVAMPMQWEGSDWNIWLGE